MDNFKKIQICGFDKSSEPEIILDNDDIYLHFNSFPPLNRPNSVSGEIFETFDKELEKITGLKVIWDDREVFIIKKSLPDTHLKLKDYLDNFWNNAIKTKGKKEILLQHIKELFITYGFNKTRKSEGCGVYRTTNYGIDSIHAVIEYSGPINRIGWIASIQFKEIEEIFAKSWGFKYSKDSSTLHYLYELGNKKIGHNLFFEIETEQDLYEMFKTCDDKLVKEGIKFFDENNTIVKADEYFNNLKPENHKYGNVGSAFKGLIVAKLLHRPDFDYLVEFYRQKALRFPNDFRFYYPDKFNNLVDYLTTL